MMSKREGREREEGGRERERERGQSGERERERETFYDVGCLRVGRGEEWGKKALALWSLNVECRWALD